MYPQTAWCSSESTLICLAVMIVGGHYHLLLSIHNIIIRPLVTPVYSIQIIFSCIYLSLDSQEMSFPGHSHLLRKAQIFHTHSASHEWKPSSNNTYAALTAEEEVKM